MQAVSVSRVLVWSRWLRISHWLIAIATLGLIGTGWLMRVDSILSPAVSEVHFMLASALIPALLVRLYLLFFGKGTEHLEDCEPDLHRLRQAIEVLKFYLTLGRAPLPKWFSHNPLWGPLYLVLFLFLTLSTTSGVLLLQEVPLTLGISQYDLHRLSYYVVFLFTILHIPAVFSHDLSHKNSDISGMVNGYKTFPLEKSVYGQDATTHSVSLETLLKTRK